MKLPMENMEVAVKRKVSMLEIRDLTKKEAYLMSFFSSLRGGKVVHNGFSRIVDSRQER